MSEHYIRGLQAVGKLKQARCIETDKFSSECDASEVERLWCLLCLWFVVQAADGVGRSDGPPEDKRTVG